jgi:CelD/BcsL family acetyltransferase involved in cellulose biosynthesis
VWIGLVLSMSFRIHTMALKDFPAAYIQYWDKCVADNQDLTPFHSYRWLSSWTEAYDAVQSATVLMVLDDADRPLGLLPLMKWNGVIRSLSYNASDYTGTVWTRNPGAVAAALAAHLRHMAATERVMLWNVRESDPLIAILKAQNQIKLNNRAIVSSIAMSASRFRPWNQLSPVSARELVRKRQRLEKKNMSVFFNSSVDSLTLAAMVDIHTRSWHRRGGSGSFVDERRLDFVRLLLNSRLPLLFILMYLGNRLVSYRFGPIDERTYYDWNTGTDPEHSRFTPGLVLLNMLVERMRQSERVTTIDFLRGGEDYKRAWHTQLDWVSEYEVIVQPHPE